MRVFEITNKLNDWAPPSYQENYDNCGLITGDPLQECTGILCSLDVTEDVVDEAILLGCNMIVAHHPILFFPLKKLSGTSYVERTLRKAIKHDVAIFAIHTNLDNVHVGVNRIIAEKLELQKKSISILSPKASLLSKLYTYVPVEHSEKVKSALFEAGAGQIGFYVECSFSTEGTGTFRPLPGSDPTIGEAGGRRESVREHKLEVIFPGHLSTSIVKVLKQAHPYEEVAYEIVQLQNENQEVGSGMIGELEEAIPEKELLRKIKTVFGTGVFRHTPLLNKPVKKIAVCGGAGSFLTKTAISAGADAYITADIKYHEFFDADNRLLLIDAGHWETEQFTIDLIANFLQANFPTFAVLKTGMNTNPVQYFG